MGDDFDFSRPRERREPAKFEPPPWEAEAFEQRKRELEQVEKDRQAHPPSDVPAEEAVSDPVVAPEQARPAETPAHEKRGEKAEGEIDELRVSTMLAALRDEMPTDSRLTANVSYGVALLLTALGMMLVVWAMAAFASARSTGTIGAIGGLVLLGFGAGFIGLAIWLVVRTLRQRGVL